MGLGKRWRPNDNPERNSLWLLPSGPDQVGEASVRRRSPRRYMRVWGSGGKWGRVAGGLMSSTDGRRTSPSSRHGWAWGRDADAVLAAPLIYCGVTGHKPRNFGAGQQRRRACADSAGPCPRFFY